MVAVALLDRAQTALAEVPAYIAEVDALLAQRAAEDDSGANARKAMQANYEGDDDIFINDDAEVEEVEGGTGCPQRYGCTKTTPRSKS